MEYKNLLPLVLYFQRLIMCTLPSILPPAPPEFQADAWQLGDGTLTEVKDYQPLNPNLDQVLSESSGMKLPLPRDSATQTHLYQPDGEL